MLNKNKSVNKTRYSLMYTRIQAVISSILKLIIIGAIIISVIKNNWLDLFISSLALILTFIPAILEHNFKVSLPTELEFLFVIFVYASLFLGEINAYYIKYWWWDIALHTFSGVALGFVGFMVIYLLYTKNKIQSNYFLIAIFAFCFALSCGAIWEIFEFTVDITFGTNMQKSGLVDTMIDLIVDAIGAIFVSIYGYFYLKHNKESIVGRWIKRFLSKNNKLYYT